MSALAMTQPSQQALKISFRHPYGDRPCGGGEGLTKRERAPGGRRAHHVVDDELWRRSTLAALDMNNTLIASAPRLRPAPASARRRVPAPRERAPPAGHGANGDRSSRYPIDRSLLSGADTPAYPMASPVRSRRRDSPSCRPHSTAGRQPASAAPSSSRRPRSGWAYERGQCTPGVACVAATVDYRIPATDAISCSVPAGLAPALVERVTEALVRRTRALAATLRREGIR